jgi:short-subunit dehydrogenase
MFGEFRDALLTTPGEMSSEARFDILINNAGFDGRTSLGATDASTMDALYRLHVKGPILLTKCSRLTCVTAAASCSSPLG